MRNILLAGVAVLGLCGAAHADDLDDQIRAVEAAQAADKAENGGRCFHACNPCDYAFGSGAQIQYDLHHKIKLAKKCRGYAK